LYKNKNKKIDKKMGCEVELIWISRSREAAIKKKRSAICMASRIRESDVDSDKVLVGARSGCP
jgi:hypothetical protein